MDQHKRTHLFNIYIRLYVLLGSLKKRYDYKVAKHREERKRKNLVELIYYRYTLLSQMKYGNLLKKQENKVRDSMTLLGQIKYK